ncbi:LIM zinc-binding domain-containing protein [Forsythia ovata]|uniref:LIM zinc-binding domain-containing protein n=1 Tax=Forsythia ovata TaxID=205694 RepID=A0ABD1RLX3_9LAMI
MAWLNKIFERPNQKVSKGRYDPRNGSDTEDTWSETEDRDHAIALSLSEEDHNAKNGTDCNSQLEEDEDLARALQESLNVESPQDSDGNNNGTRNENLSTYLSISATKANCRVSRQPAWSWLPSNLATIIGCYIKVQQGREPTDVDFCSTAIDGGLENDILQQRLHTVLKQREQLQHIEIGLRAQEQLHKRGQQIHELERKIEEKERELNAIRLDNEDAWAKEDLLREQSKELQSYSGQNDISGYLYDHHAIHHSHFSTSEGLPYHKDCCKQSQYLECDVCKNIIPRNEDGLIEYKAHPFWLQKHCPCHDHDGTPRCCSCQRMESNDTSYVALDDGRNLCLECLDSAVIDTNECQPLYLDILDFYEGLNMEVKQQVPLLLVERRALNEAWDEEMHFSAENAEVEETLEGGEFNRAFDNCLVELSLGETAMSSEHNDSQNWSDPCTNLEVMGEASSLSFFSPSVEGQEDVD